MNKYLEIHKLPKLTKDEIGNFNRPGTSKDFEWVIKNLGTKKSSGPIGFTGEFFQTFTWKLPQIFLKLFQEIKEERIS